MVNLGKKLMIWVFLLILLSMFVYAQSKPYYRNLGDGCNDDIYFSSCKTGCEWVKTGTSLSKICETAHGWCRDPLTNVCGTCDFVKSTTEFPIYHTCQTIDCTTYGLDPLPGTTELERVHIYNLCAEQGIANPDNPLSQKGTIWCKDQDGDGYGINCGFNRNACEPHCVKSTNLKSLEPDCDDTNPKINPESIWIIDRDNDGRWGDVIIQCEQRSNIWQLVDNLPNPDLFDCDDLNPVNLEFPIGCPCNPREEGRIINNAFCYNKFGERGIEAKGDTITFVPTKHISGYVWAEKSIKADFNKNLVDCPLETCPLVSKDYTKYCALPGSYWDDDGNFEMVGGNNYCKYDEGNAFWSKRSSSINALFMTMGELSGKDFTVYCDDLENIIHTTDFNKASAGFNPFIALKALTSDPTSTRLGQGCVLLINTPNLDGRDYSIKIYDGDTPVYESQKVIIGMILNQRDVETAYFQVDFSQRRNVKNWWFGRSFGENNGLIYDEENQILLIAQTIDGKIDEELMSYVDLIINPNDFTINFYKMLLDPIRSFINIFNSNAYDPKKYTKIMATNFDKSYLSMNEGTYFYSVLEGNDLISKIVNPSTSMEKFIIRTCNDELFETDFRCTGIEENIVSNVVGLTSNLQSLNPTEKEEMWRRFSRQIRLQGNIGGGGNFRDGECTGNDLSDCTSKTCFEAISCLPNKMCEYKPITQCIPNDGCCPPGCYYEDGDNDCPPRPTLHVPVLSNLRYGLKCETNETILLRLSYFYNAHVEDPNVIFSPSNSYKHFNNLLCITSELGRFSAHLRGTCRPDEETVLSLFKTSNSHVAKPDSTLYNHKLCLKHDLFKTHCKIDSQEGCIGYSIIASITDLENGQIGKPEFYENKLCCNLFEN